VTTTERKLLMIARRLGRLDDAGTRDGAVTYISGGITSDEGELLRELRAVLLEEQGYSVPRCEACGSVNHRTGSFGCPAEKDRYGLS
jgi:hypothetical protein